MQRLAILSMHTSPLARLGIGDGGGMNVYVRELTAALARSGVSCDVFTRAWSGDLPPVLQVEPGFRVHHVVAGPAEEVPKEVLPDFVDAFTVGVLDRMTSPSGLACDTDDGGRFEAVHANYWLSGLAGHAIKHQLDLPLVSTFHTLDRIKADRDPEEVAADVPHRRAEAEASVIRCSDTVLASCRVEAEQIADLYPAEPTRVRVVAPAVDHAFFSPGHRPQARRALGLEGDGPLLLFVGRIQPLKRADIAVRTLAALSDTRARLVIVGGPSGQHGSEAYRDLVALTDELELADRVQFVEPQPHELLSTFYRAADVCLVPSRSESFGLVALEAAACGTPVIASAVGGLLSLVDHGHTGFLVDEAAPELFAGFVERLTSRRHDEERFSAASAVRARPYTWKGAATSLLEIYEELLSGMLVEC